MISARYAIPAALLLALALVPTTIHTYVGASVEDGRTAVAIPEKLGDFVGVSTDRRGAWVKDLYGSSDWIERRYRAPGEADVLLFVARSFDLKRLYHHPELGVLRGVDLEAGGLANLPALGPVHVLHGRTGGDVAAYALLYEGKLIEDPIGLQIATSLRLLFSPRKPMTLFLVNQEAPAPDAPFETTAAGRVLREAIRSFIAQEEKT